MSAETSVVHVHDPGGFDKYIGRAVRRAKDPRCRKESQFANPFPCSVLGREGAIEAYEGMLREWLASSDKAFWRGQLESLRGNRLACWCKEDGHEVPCHGDILVKLLKEMEDGTP